MDELKLTNIGIDDWAIGRGNDILATVLGSCVSICLWDYKSKLGSMNHYLLPERKTDFFLRRPGADSEPKQHPGTQSHRIIDEMMQGMQHAGADFKHMKAVVVGGSEFQYDHFKVGEKNIEIALSLLRQYQITDVQVSGGGEFSRKLKFYVSDGRVVIHKLPLGNIAKATEEIIDLGGKWK